MRDETQPDGLHAALARMVWAAAPVVRLHYDRADDALVAEIVQADVEDEVVALDHLLVEFDGGDGDAMPTTLCLTGLRAVPDAPAVSAAREVLGEEVWATVAALVAGPTVTADVHLDRVEAEARRTAWRGLAARLHERARTDGRFIGVEFVPGRVHAVLTDAAVTVLDEEVVDLDRNDPDAVVDAVDRAVRALAARHSGTGAVNCPVGVQLGGPVDTTSGLVEYYDKPLHPDDESWRGVPLGPLLDLRMGRTVLVFNDAWALAAMEAAREREVEVSKVGVLVVRQGVGAKLIRAGQVEDDFPMEIGIFVPAPGAALDGTHDRVERSIEASSGTAAIVAAVERVTGRDCRSIDDAGALADCFDGALAVFNRAGQGLARGIAAIQAVVAPDEWVVFGPQALVDEDRAPGREFMRGLRQVGDHLDYGGLLPANVVSRSTTSRSGAEAAVRAARAWPSDGRR
jgi:predicted NBD/HSP70 family sugar kinase